MGGLACTHARMYIRRAVCRVCSQTQCHDEHILRKRKRITPCVVLEACNGTFAEDNMRRERVRTRTHTHSRVEILHYTVIVSACQMAPDIRQRLGIKLSERLLPRPPTLFSHPPSLGIINFIISVIIIVKLFFIFLHFFFPSPPLLAQNTKCMLMCFGDCQRTRRWGEVERNENERGCEMGRGWVDGER